MNEIKWDELSKLPLSVKKYSVHWHLNIQISGDFIFIYYDVPHKDTFRMCKVWNKDVAIAVRDMLELLHQEELI